METSPYITLAVLAGAFLLDLAAGDPEWLPHPVRWIGRLISSIERILRSIARTPSGERRAGLLLALIVPGSVLSISALILHAALSYSPLLYFPAAVYMAWTSLATRSLGDEAEGVLRALDTGGLEAGRERLQRIVGRQTGGLTREGVLTATAETVAENTSDGVVAPLFYFAAGGPAFALLFGLFGGPALTGFLAGGAAMMLAYKAVNTLDSMVGYKNERYIHFGRASARLDDAANFLPSRLTALIMVASSAILRYDWRGAIRVARRDGANHPSPNAGLVEAAAAGALGVRFGGPMSYGGVLFEKPYIGDDLAEVGPGTVSSSIRMLLAASVIMAASVAVTLALAIRIFALLFQGV